MIINKRIISFFTLFLLFISLALVSCKFNNEVKLTKENLQYADRNLQNAMKNSVWHCDNNPLSNNSLSSSYNSLFQISNLHTREITYTFYNPNDLLDNATYSFIYEIVPYDEVTFIKLSCASNCENFNGNLVIEINIELAEKGSLKVRINGGKTYDYIFMSPEAVPVIPNNPNPYPDFEGDNNIPNPSPNPNPNPTPDTDTGVTPNPEEDGGESIPSIPENQDINTFKNLLRDYYWCLFDVNDTHYTRGYYPGDSNSNKMYFIQSYKLSKRIYDPYGNVVKSPIVILFFTENYSINSKGHVVMNGNLSHGLLRGGSDGDFTLYRFETLDSFIQRISVEVRSVLPTYKGYNVDVTDDQKRNHKEEFWQGGYQK